MQLPQPGKLKPLQSIDLPAEPSSSTKSAGLFSDDSSGTISYKFANKPKPQMSAVRNANEVIAHDPLDAYRSHHSTNTSSSNSISNNSSSASSSSTFASTSRSTDFLQRLDRQATTIDFNSRSPPRSGLVSIHKRERTSPLFGNDASTGGGAVQQQQQMLKRRRLRLVPNDAPAASGGGGSGDAPVAPSLPSDRHSLLELLKSSLAPAKYALFIKTLIEYQRESDVQQLIAAFVEIFDQPQFYYLFRGMRRFVKDSHKAVFDADVERLL